MPSPSKAKSDIDLLNPFWDERVERWVLPNGLTLIVKPDHSAELASVQVWVKTGSLHEGRFSGAGVSHFLEHMLFKGTKRRQGREISAEVQSLGGYINAYTTFDRTVYYIDLPAEHADKAIDILSDSVLHSSLPKDEFLKERDVILREIAMTRDEPDQRLGEALFDIAFKTHPYRYPIIGHKPVFETLTHEDLLSYYQARYCPNNLVVVVVGAVDASAIRASVEATFGGEPRRALEPVLIPEEPLQLASRSQAFYEDVELTRAGMAWQVPGLTHPDAPLLDLLATILGSGDSSPLWQELREKARLVHTIDASCWNPGSVGLFYISITCDADKRLKVSAAVKSLLKRFAQRGPTPAQMKRAIRQLVVGEINTRKTMSGQASRIGASEVVAGDLSFSRSYFECLRRAKPSDLRRIARDFLVESRLTEVSSSPKASAPVQVGRAAETLVKGDFESKRLANGARIVWQVNKRLPNLHCRVIALGGPASEEKGKRGASALLATLLSKDTKQRSAEEVALAVESVGGSLVPFSGNNSVGLAVELLPTDQAVAMRTLSEAILSPAFLKETLEMERESQLAEHAQDADDIVTHARKQARLRFFGDHPLAMDAQGDEAGVKALGVADIRALHKRLFVGGNVVLAIAGDFDPKKLLPQAEKWLSKLPKGPALPLSPRHQAGPGASVELPMEREQAVILQSYPGPSLLDPDYYVGEVMDELFSGMASRLFERVREEKGLAYFVRSSRVTGLSSGMFQFLAGTQPGRETEVFAEIDAEVARVTAGEVAPAELARCQARLVAGRRQSLQTNGARALNAGLNVLFGLPVNDWMNYDTRVAAVRAQDLAAFAKKYLDNGYKCRLRAGPALKS